MQELGSVAPGAKDWSIYLIGQELHIADGNSLLQSLETSSPATKVIMELCDPEFYPSCKECGDSSSDMYCGTCASYRNW